MQFKIVNFNANRKRVCISGLYFDCRGWEIYRVFTRSSKRLALARVFWIHLLGVCWTFAGSCK